MYLVDTNIWLERLLGQQRTEEVGEFLDRVGTANICLSDFSLHSICVILGRGKKLEALTDFIDDLFTRNGVGVRGIRSADLGSVIEDMAEQGLDFDDAYQYRLCKRDNLRLVSFDTDFDKSDLPRLTPANVSPANPVDGQT